MTTLTNEGDSIIGKRIVYVARKVSGLRLIMKSVDTEVWKAFSMTEKPT